MSKKSGKPQPGKGTTPADPTDPDLDEGESRLPPRSKSKAGEGKAVVTVMDKSGVKRKVTITRQKSIKDPDVPPSNESLPPPSSLMMMDEPKDKNEDEEPAPTVIPPAPKKKVEKEAAPPPPIEVQVQVESKPGVKKQKKVPNPIKSESGISLNSKATEEESEYNISNSTIANSTMTVESSEQSIPPPVPPPPPAQKKNRRKKVQKGTYKKYFDLSALDAELRDTGSSKSESDSSEEHQGEEDENHPDMNWISKDDQPDQTVEEGINVNLEENVKNSTDNVKDKNKKKKSTSKNNNNSKSKKALDPYIWTCFGLGRLPFRFTVDGKTGAQKCTMPYKSWPFAVFVLTTVIMTLALLQIAFSFMSLFNSDLTKESNSTKYIRLELLLVNNWWLPISIFILTLLMVVVGSISVIVSGPLMAVYITGWMNTLTHFENVGYTTHSKTLRQIAWAHPISTGLNLIAILGLCGAEAFTFQEPIQAITLLLFRDFKESLYFSMTKHKNVPASAPGLVYFVAVFMVYVCFSARSLLVIIIIFCRGIVYLAEQWNIRLAVILRKLTAERAGLKTMKPLKYEDLLRDHQKIVVLVSGISGTFSTVLVMYALVECFKLIMALFATSQDLAIATHEFNDTFVPETGVRYQKDIQDEWFEIFYHLMHTIMSFSLVSWGATTAGDMVMTGFDTVRRHGLLLANGVKERKFIMSLNMSYNAASPHVICPGNWFLFNRGFIMSVFCGAMAVYSLLIQVSMVHKIDVPIVFTCLERNKGDISLCFGSKEVNYPGGASEKDINKAGEEFVQEFKKVVKKIPTTTTTPHPTTIPPKDVDGFLPPDATEAEFEEKCIRYCKGSLIRRPVAYNVNGKRYLPLPEDMTLDDCILRPYQKIIDSGVDVIYNCKKVKTSVKDLDECGQPGISRSFKGDPEIKAYYTDSNGDYKCFDEKSTYTNPLERCNVPHTAVSTVKNATRRNKPLPRSVFGIPAFNNTLQPVPPEKDKALCNISEMASDPDPRTNSYAIKYGIVQNFTINGIVVWRMTGFTMRFINKKANKSLTTHAIPLTGSPQDKLGRPYAYIHPRTMANATDTRTDKETIYTEYSYGYYDCFGEPLLKFDDCGNLPFSLVKDGAHEPQEKKFENIKLKNGEPKYCYKSPIPNYKCGVPEELVDEACRLWKTYLENSALY